MWLLESSDLSLFWHPKHFSGQLFGFVRPIFLVFHLFSLFIPLILMLNVIPIVLVLNKNHWDWPKKPAQYLQLIYVIWKPSFNQKLVFLPIRFSFMISFSLLFLMQHDFINPNQPTCLFYRF